VKVQATVPFPLGPYDAITREAAEKIIGTEMPLHMEDGHEVGTCLILSVDWKSPTNVKMCVELDTTEEVAQMLEDAYELGRITAIQRLDMQRENRGNN
jgi:hypothetical protein